jgi:hypothetical protein
MRAVWSFWTKPFTAHYSGMWASETHHLLAWVLSVETARKHYPDTALVTDDAGARMLVDGLGLAFEHISTELNALHDEGAGWWTLGKLYAYRSQVRPFVHIDSDVFLWKALPSRIRAASIFAQNPEDFPPGGDHCYRPNACTSAIRAIDGWLPEEWAWYAAAGGNRAVNCGVLGGSNVHFLQHYAELAIEIVRHPRNQAAWPLLGIRWGDAVLIEQYLLSACIEYSKSNACPKCNSAGISYLFPSFGNAFNEGAARRLGYTHLLGPAKKNKMLMQRLERRVHRDYPEYYERCIKFVTRSR